MSFRVSARAEAEAPHNRRRTEDAPFPFNRLLCPTSCQYPQIQKPSQQCKANVGAVSCLWFVWQESPNGDGGEELGVATGSIFGLYSILGKVMYLLTVLEIYLIIP